MRKTCEWIRFTVTNMFVVGVIVYIYNIQLAKEIQYNVLGIGLIFIVFNALAAIPLILDAD